MKKSLLLGVFALSLVLVSCSSEGKIDKLLDKAEQENTQYNDAKEDLQKSTFKVQFLETVKELKSFKESDFNIGQAERYGRVSSSAHYMRD